ncbi:hypothetical protein GCM10009779_64820 [Polymorphospora rubra]|uniref:Helix-turn-helix domain-containing protein n=1 Tax=Polymorphospora rubra TaxID=338584 RepID=A0A810MX57_9ACTN|nr:hypothetical protein Prubr_21050 [Polymorphospora rubra]
MQIPIPITARRKTCTARYALAMPPPDPADLEKRVREGAWLLAGDVAKLLGVDPATVWRWTKSDPPFLRYRHRSGRGRYREYHPEDVLRELESSRQVEGESQS